MIGKGLSFLIPFYLFKFEKLIQDKLGYDDGRMQKLKEDYTKLREYLDESCRTGKINEYEMLTIRDMLKKVADNLSKGADTVKKEVEDIMGGRVLEYEAKTILNRGRAEGRAEGCAEGMDRVSKLVNYLASQGKTDEVLKVTSDPEYRDRMLDTLNM